MFQLINARPTEFLVVSRGGKLRNLGVGGNAVLWPGTTVVTVPSVKQEACFAMTQESRDGIPLRFKGIVIFRVVDPVAAATFFDFGSDQGLHQLQEIISHVCLGELRDLVSHMSMAECIEQRKSTLTETVSAALRAVAEKGDGLDDIHWGIAIDLVQVAQVFIVDDELRTKLEAELRDEVEARSQQSRIEMEQRVELVRLGSERRLAEERLENEREQRRIALEELHLQQAFEREQAESAAPLRQLQLDRDREVAELEIEVRRVLNQLRALEVEGELVGDRARQALEQEILPQKQIPEIAESLASMFQGAHLSLYGSDNQVAQILAPLMDLLGATLGKTRS